MIAEHVQAELDQLGSAAVAPGLTALAIDLAQTVDATTDAPSSKAVVARELSAVMTKLRGLSSTSGKGGALDEITRRREARLKQQADRAAGGR